MNPDTGPRSGNAAAEAYNVTSRLLFSRRRKGKIKTFPDIFLDFSGGEKLKKKGEGLSTSTPTFLISFLKSGEDSTVNRLSLKPEDGGSGTSHNSTVRAIYHANNEMSNRNSFFFRNVSI